MSKVLRRRKKLVHFGQSNQYPSLHRIMYCINYLPSRVISLSSSYPSLFLFLSITPHLYSCIAFIHNLSNPSDLDQSLIHPSLTTADPDPDPELELELHSDPDPTFFLLFDFSTVSFRVFSSNPLNESFISDSSFPSPFAIEEMDWTLRSSM